MRIGNRQGWIFAAVVAVVYGGLVYTLENSGAASGPTPLATSSDAMAELALPPGADSLVPMPEARDATDLIRRLTKTVAATPREYEGFPLAEVPRITGLGILLDQASLASAPRRAKDPEYSLGYKPPAKGEAEAFETLSGAVQRAAILYRAAKRPDEGKALFQAEYSLGYKLFNARHSYADVRNALLLMSDGVAGMKYFAKDTGDPAAIDRLQAIEDSLKELGKRSQSVWTAIGSVDPGVIGQHAGDIPIIALSSKERVWRTEATLKLGRMRYSVGTGTGTDQRAARKTIKTLLTDPDPAVVHAAKLASQLSIEDYRSLR